MPGELLLDITNLVKNLCAQCGDPIVLRFDNGLEFISHALNEFAVSQFGIHYIPLGQPWRNGYVESFNRRVRNECLNINSLDHIYEAHAITSDWK